MTVQIHRVDRADEGAQFKIDSLEYEQEAHRELASVKN